MVLSVNKIKKYFGDKEVLKEISFKAESSGALGLLGRNGAGKTTTVRIIMGIFLPDSGEVTIDGVPIGSSGTKKVRIGYMPEERGLYPRVVVMDQMVYIGRLRGLSASDAKKRAAMLLDKLQAGEYADKKLETLSKGNQQKIQLAISVINDPDIVILDEPFSGLDPVNAKLLKELVEDLVREKKIVLFSSHQMSYVEEFCQHICIINKGAIVLDGVLSEIKRGYPRNRISVVPEGGVAAFIEKLKSDSSASRIITEIKPYGGSCIITLNDQDSKNALFRIIGERGLSVDGFKVVEPSLEEIFIEKAGAVDA